MKNYFYLLFLILIVSSCDDQSEYITPADPDSEFENLYFSTLAKDNLKSIESQRELVTSQLNAFNLSTAEKEKIAKHSGGNASFADQSKELNNQGNIHYTEGNFDLALYYYYNSLQIKLETPGDEGLSVTYRNVALAYQALGDYKNAAINFWQALLIAEELDNVDRIAMLYNDLGVIYDLAYDFGPIESFDPETSASVSLYEKALSISISINNTERIAQANFNLELLYDLKEDSSTARRRAAGRDQDDVEDQL